MHIELVLRSWINTFKIDSKTNPQELSIIHSKEWILRLGIDKQYDDHWSNSDVELIAYWRCRRATWLWVWNILTTWAMWIWHFCCCCRCIRSWKLLVFIRAIVALQGDNRLCMRKTTEQRQNSTHNNKKRQASYTYFMWVVHSYIAWYIFSLGCFYEVK